MPKFTLFHKSNIMSKKILLFAAAMTLLNANAQQKWEIGNPNDETNYGYLKNYQALKLYIDTEKYPNFKLGVGTTVNDYLQKGLVYNLTNANFTETVAASLPAKTAEPEKETDEAAPEAVPEETVEESNVSETEPDEPKEESAAEVTPPDDRTEGEP